MPSSEPISKRAAQVAEALGFINDCNLGGIAREEGMHLVVEEFFVDPESESEVSESDSSDDDDDGGELDVEEIVPAIDEARDEAEPMDISDASEDEDVDRDPVVVQPVLPDGSGDVPQEQQHQIAAHQHERECDELVKARNFTCTCKYFESGPCFSRYTPEYLRDCRDSMKEMTSGEIDMFILGMLRCLTNTSETTQRAKKRKTDRQRHRTKFLVEGQIVCKETFCFMYGFSEKKLRNLQNWYSTHGLTSRRKKAGGRQSHRMLKYEDITRVYTFITNYAEDHAVCLPGRVPGFRRGDLKLLPCSTTKQGCYELYKAAMAQTEHRAVCSSSFRKLWLRLCPNIVRCKPATDLCWTCQHNHNTLMRAANLGDAEKGARCQAQMDHLTHVDEERELYRDLVKKSTEVVDDTVKLQGGVAPKAHYSFDFAQQVHFPANPRQPGPIYFLTPRKCGLFGINCEAVRQQVNYLIDEGVSSGKGSNSVISYLHHFFAEYGLGEAQVDLHCDNCAGQNKNRFMLWYLCWRVYHGYHQSVSLHFMVPGHTKFAPDACFGLVKKRFAVSEVNCLDDIKQVVTESSKVNLVQVIGTESQQMNVSTYNWQEFLSPFFRALNGIKSMHHFRFTSDDPGVVFYRQRVSDPEKRFQLLTNLTNPPPASINENLIVPPPGLSSQRQWYLYEKIREFCLAPESQDKACPKPTIPK